MATNDTPQLASPIMALDTITISPKLPQELKDRIWESATPGAQILLVDAHYAVTSITKFERSEITLRSIEESRYTLSFGQQVLSGDNGMFLACHNSREAVLKRFPLRLKSSIVDEELRIGLNDVIAISNLTRFLNILKTGERKALTNRLALGEITTIGLIAHAEGEYMFLEFPDFAVLAYLETCMPTLAALRTLILDCADDVYPIRDFSFSAFTEDFETDLQVLAISGSRGAQRAAMLEEAKDAKWLYNTGKSFRGLVNIPDIKIMARGWPSKNSHRLEAQRVEAERCLILLQKYWTSQR